MDSKPVSANTIARVARALALEHKDRLDELKAKRAECSRPDFLWHYLLQSFATMGGSSGWAGLIGNRVNYAKTRFDVLEGLEESERGQHILEVCRDAKVRWPERKSRFILAAYSRTVELGGPSAASAKLLESRGREAKMHFLRSFAGIGDKYARNMMMDVYHEDFHDSIALDSRIKALSSAWGLSFSSYEEHEGFYLGVAASADLNGWELDRLLYNFHDEFLNQIKSLSR